jgi:hypothetical protein
MSKGILIISLTFFVILLFAKVVSGMCVNNQPGWLGRSSCTDVCSGSGELCYSGCTNSQCSNCQDSCSAGSHYCYCIDKHIILSFDLPYAFGSPYVKVVQGYSNKTTITAVIQDYPVSQPLSLSASNIPNGISVSFSPVSCQVNSANAICYSNITISASPNAVPMYPFFINITATADIRSNFTILELYVLPSSITKIVDARPTCNETRAYLIQYNSTLARYGCFNGYDNINCAGNIKTCTDNSAKSCMIGYSVPTWGGLMIISECMNVQPINKCSTICSGQSLECARGCNNPTDCHNSCNDNSYYCLCSGVPSDTFKLWIEDPNENLLVNGADMGDCTKYGDTTECFYNYKICDSRGVYQGLMYYNTSFTEWKPWFCGCENGNITLSPAMNYSLFSNVVSIDFFNINGKIMAVPVYVIDVMGGIPSEPFYPEFMAMSIRDPNGNNIFDNILLGECSSSSSTTSCFAKCHFCDINGWYQGSLSRMDSSGNILSTGWKNLWCCGQDCPVSPDSLLSVYISGYKTCSVSANMSSNLNGKQWNIQDSNGNVKCSGTVSGTSYTYTCQNWTVGVGTHTYNLYVDNTKMDSKRVDCKVSETCDYNRKCEGSENCLTCQNDCGCSINQTCSFDGTCKNIPTPPPCNKNGLCEPGEGCTCSDCIGKKDSCGEGDLICLITTDPSTNNTCQCPSDKPYWCTNHCDISSNCTCGNGIPDQGENCKNCPNDVGCLNGTRCCQDGTCGKDCSGSGCDSNVICDRNETYYETCDCSDCLYSQDRCMKGDVCIIGDECGCNPISDGICTSDLSCVASDPDCQCNNNGICETGETQDGCPTDCSTKVIVSPSKLYPGEKVNVTVYFNDSRYVGGENAKIVLYIDSTPWTSCAVHDSKWVDNLKWDKSASWMADNVIGSIQGISPSSVNIVSTNSYAKIKFDCTVPSDLPQGIHILKAVPYIYSKEIKLGSSETQFTVSSNSLIIAKLILFSIKLIF